MEKKGDSHYFKPAGKTSKGGLHFKPESKKPPVFVDLKEGEGFRMEKPEAESKSQEPAKKTGSGTPPEVKNVPKTEPVPESKPTPEEKLFSYTAKQFGGGIAGRFSAPNRDEAIEKLKKRGMSSISVIEDDVVKPIEIRIQNAESKLEENRIAREKDMQLIADLLAEFGKIEREVDRRKATEVALQSMNEREVELKEGARRAREIFDSSKKGVEDHEKIFKTLDNLSINLAQNKITREAFLAEFPKIGKRPTETEPEVKNENPSEPDVISDLESRLSLLRSKFEKTSKIRFIKRSQLKKEMLELDIEIMRVKMSK